MQFFIMIFTICILTSDSMCASQVLAVDEKKAHESKSQLDFLNIKSAFKTIGKSNPQSIITLRMKAKLNQEKAHQEKIISLVKNEIKRLSEDGNSDRLSAQRERMRKINQCSFELRAQRNIAAKLGIDVAYVQKAYTFNVGLPKFEWQ